MSVTGLIASKQTLVHVDRRTLAHDAGGSPVHSWTRHISNVPMFMQPRGGDEAVRYGRESNRPFAVFYCAPPLDIKEKDKLVTGDREWDIQVVTQPGNFGSGEPTGHMRIEAQEVRL